MEQKKINELIFQIGHTEDVKKFPAVKIRPEAYKILKYISDRTGMKQVDVASRMIEFAYAHTTII